MSTPTNSRQRGAEATEDASCDTDVFVRMPSDSESASAEYDPHAKGGASKVDVQESLFDQALQTGAPLDTKPKDDLLGRREARRRSSLVPIEVLLSSFLMFEMLCVGEMLRKGEGDGRGHIKPFAFMSQCIEPFAFMPCSDSRTSHAGVGCRDASVRAWSWSAAVELRGEAQDDVEEGDDADDAGLYARGGGGRDFAKSQTLIPKPLGDEALLPESTQSALSVSSCSIKISTVLTLGNL